MSAAMISVKDYEEGALLALDRNTKDYYRSGADEQLTLHANQADFNRLIIRPNQLNDVSQISMSTTIQGEKINFPICVAPTAMHRLAHPDGEIATAKGTAACGVCFTLSTISTTGAQEISDNVSDSLKWFQLYIFRDRGVTETLVRRVEKAGFKALVLTIDTPEFGLRRSDRKYKFSLPPHLRMANFDGISLEASVKMCGDTKPDDSALVKYSKNLMSNSVTWKDIRWLKSITRLPIISKGVLTAEDAERSIQAGCAGIVVSNHGARQLDGVSSTIMALPEIVRAVDGRCEVYLDGGVRKGTDVLKALALGARAVFVGRPILWGLTVEGEEGVKNILNLLKEELERAMRLSGVSDVNNIPQGLVAPRYPEFTSKL